MPHSDAEGLGQLENVTSALELQYTSSVWNPLRKMLLLKYRFLNTSRDVIGGPFKVRILNLESDLGIPTLVFTHGSSNSEGTVLDLSDLIPRLGLAPGQATTTQAMVVKFDSVGELPGGSQRDIVHMKVEVFGIRRKVANELR